MTFRLEGTKSNRDGVGASVTVMAGGRRQVAQRCGGGSYQSANDPRLHFGLAAAIASTRSKFAGRRDRSTAGRFARRYRVSAARRRAESAPLAGFRAGKIEHTGQ